MAMRCLALATWLCWPLVAGALPTFEQVKSQYQPSETWILSREGETVHRLRTDFSVRRGQWLSLKEVSPSVLQALLVSEDQRFYAHSGVDWQSVSAAAWANVWQDQSRGASTITMQLVGLLQPQWRARNQGRSWEQKIGQAWAATQLEQQWHKDEILEAYLNLLPFRGELVGLDALSRSLFGKAAHGLNAQEAAIAAALVRGPNAAPPVVAQRACQVWQALQAQPLLLTPANCTALQWQMPQILQARRWPAQEGVAPHWAQRVWAQQAAGNRQSGQSLRTTLSAPVQRLALDSVQRHLQELQGHNVEDAAVLVLDNHSGAVLAWVGSSGHFSQATEVDAVLAWRQTGSSLKPFLYAQALQEQRLTAASLLHDSDAQLSTGSGLYMPQNYDRSYRGWVSVRQALAASLNVPAVRTLVMVTPDAFFHQLQQLGMPLRESGGFYGWSLALGSAEVPLLHLTNAYRALANQGWYTPVAPALWATLPPSTPVPGVQVLTPQAAFVVGDILADAQMRASTFGLDSVLATRFWSAVKTGTSKDMRDNWAVGWSQHYTVGVWVGNASGEAMHHVSGSAGAAPIWADIMAGLHQQRSSRPPAPPEGMVQQVVHFVAPEGVLLPEVARQEWFAEGMQQAQFTLPASSHAVGQPRIVRPAPGSILALDPDIPPDQQRLLLQASSDQVHWWLAGQWLGEGKEVQWQIWPGRHWLELKDAQGRRLDRVRLEVRGAVVRQTPDP